MKCMSSPWHCLQRIIGVSSISIYQFVYPSFTTYVFFFFLYNLNFPTDTSIKWQNYTAEFTTLTCLKEKIFFHNLVSTHKKQILSFFFCVKRYFMLFLWCTIVYINYNLLAHTVFKLINRVSHFPNFPFDFWIFFLQSKIQFNLWIIGVCLLVFNYGHFGCY